VAEPAGADLSPKRAVDKRIGCNGLPSPKGSTVAAVPDRLPRGNRRTGRQLCCGIPAIRYVRYPQAMATPGRRCRTL